MPPAGQAAPTLPLPLPGISYLVIKHHETLFPCTVAAPTLSPRCLLSLSRVSMMYSPRRNLFHFPVSPGYLQLFLTSSAHVPRSQLRMRAGLATSAGGSGAPSMRRRFAGGTSPSAVGEAVSIATGSVSGSGTGAGCVAGACESLSVVGQG